MVVFKSRLLLHEVLPSIRRRFAITRTRDSRPNSRKFSARRACVSIGNIE